MTESTRDTTMMTFVDEEDVVEIRSTTLPPGENDELDRRYEIDSQLGAGGVGEVHLARDRRIGRLVALKFLRPDRQSERADARFIREICLQGQLEHPSIVPVYDLGTDEDGHTYFSMRRVRGITLQEVIERLKETPDAYSTHKLLSSFVSVCLAIDFAHRRRVVHRDLKPSNVMLGDFGEAYVLDWGVAKLLGLDDDDQLEATTLPEDVTTLETKDGATVGTLGFMPPEQLRGDKSRIGPPTDVYALGAILFQLLSGQPLHSGDTPFAVVESTLAGADARISARVPHTQVAPELEEICIKATESEPQDRYATARELAEAIEAFLEGKRDAELRSKMAAEEAARGAAALGEAGDYDRRSAALRSFTRALSLDPENAAARQGLSNLLLDSPKSLPADAERELDALQLRYEKTGARRGAILLGGGLLTFIPLVMMRVVDWAIVGTFVSLIAAMGIVAMIGPRGDAKFRAYRRYLNIGLGLVGVVVAGRIFGPVVLAPSIAMSLLIPFISVEKRQRKPWLTTAFITVIVVPFLLESVGWLAPSYGIHEGALVIAPRAVEFSLGWATTYLLLMSILSVMATGVLVSGLVRRADEATRRLQLQAWYLKELVPELADALKGRRR